VSELTYALGIVAPYYNLVLVVICIYLFYKLLNTTPSTKQAFPWKIIYVAFLIYVLEELLTILRSVQILNIPIHINGFFELGIIVLFIYTILKQKEISKI